MYVPFHSLPATSRVWVYQSNKRFSEDQKNIIRRNMSAFTDEWTVHGAPMEASFDIRFDHIIIIAANDQASGCSIDASVRAIKNLGVELHIDFFNRTMVAFLEDDNIKLYPMSELKDAFAEGLLSNNSITLNNLVNTKADLDSQWILPASQTWLKKYLSIPASQH